MAFPRKKYTPRKKKFTRKRSTAVRFRSNAIIGKGFPKKMITTHKFVYNAQCLSSGGSIATEAFYVNKLDQPVVSGVTHKPMYHDQMSAVYNNNIVVGSKMSIRFTPSTAGDSDILVAVFLNDYIPTLTPSSVTAMQEQTGSQYRILGSAGHSTQFSDKVYSINSRWSAKRRYGGNVMSNDNLYASTGPVFKPSWTLAVTPFSGTTNAGINYTITIEYITVWFGVKDIDGS